MLLGVLLLPVNVLAAEPRHDELMNGFPPPADRQVSRDNWLDAPFNNWGFKHVEVLVPTVTVDRGEGPVSELTTAPVLLDDFSFTDPWDTARTFEAFLADQHVDSLLVWHNGALVAEQYRNGQTPRTRHIMFSVTKSFVGLLAELLIHEGTLDESRRVSAYLPELAGSAYQDATLRQLLDMEIGINFSEVYDDPRSDIARYTYAAGMRRAPAGVEHPSSLYEYLPTLQKQGRHGEDFHYVTANTEVLGWVLARVTGTAFAELFEQRLFQPVGPERDALFLADPRGKAVAGGGLSITARDTTRLAAMLAQEGKYQGIQVLPEAVVAKIAAGGTPRPSLWGNETSMDNSYRSQWYVHHPSKTFSASGVYGQNIYIDPAADVVVVIQSTYPEADGKFFGINDAFFHAMAARLTRAEDTQP
jgi:CubicO group peptidase (beta-lactamase class C family)